MMKSVCAVLIVLISGFIVSCTNVPGEIPVIKDPTIPSHFVSVSIPDAKDISSAVQSLRQYSDTAHAAWKVLSEAEAVKLEHLDQLVSEFSGKRTSFSEELEELKKSIRAIQENSLTQSSQFNNTSLYQYDMEVDSLTIKTLRMYTQVRSAGKAKPVMTKLVQSIQKDELEIKVRRAQYNEAAKKYNDFFWEKRTYLLQARGELPARPVRAYFNEAI